MARRKKEEIDATRLLPLTPLDRQFLKSARTKRHVRVDGKSVELSQEEIAVSTLYKNALNGSVHGMGQWLQYALVAQQKHEVELAECIAMARKMKAKQQQLLDRALSRDEPTRLILPHPDDIVIDLETGYKVVGPWDEAELLKIEKLVKRRDAFCVQAELEKCYSWPVPPDGEIDPDCPFRGGSAEFLAIDTDSDLPARFRLTDQQHLTCAPFLPPVLGRIRHL